MKNLKFILLSLAFVASSIAIYSCGDNTEESKEQQGKEYTSTYICPMHCDGSGSDKPGKCPVCDMDYVKNEAHKKDGHNH
ncbi:MAG: heavy metal-binding domain-containing protein [Saprospiraceae bacterium]|jgi:hypothetical protein|nr:heavy metal-binding domain-containing protein [Saprospiraceae bacterium]